VSAKYFHHSRHDYILTWPKHETTVNLVTNTEIKRLYPSLHARSCCHAHFRCSQSLTSVSVQPGWAALHTVAAWQCNNTTNTNTQPFYDPFSRTTWVSRWQKKASSGLYGARGNIRGRYPAGRHSIRTNQWPTSLIPHFYAGCPSCPPNLSWLRTTTKYAGFHTQWLGCVF